MAMSVVFDSDAGIKAGNMSKVLFCISRSFHHSSKARAGDIFCYLDFFLFKSLIKFNYIMIGSFDRHRIKIYLRNHAKATRI